jgi:hypothetical protein
MHRSNPIGKWQKGNLPATMLQPLLSVWMAQGSASCHCCGPKCEDYWHGRSSQGCHLLWHEQALEVQSKTQAWRHLTFVLLPLE